MLSTSVKRHKPSQKGIEEDQREKIKQNKREVKLDKTGRDRASLDLHLDINPTTSPSPKYSKSVGRHYSMVSFSLPLLRPTP